MSLVKRHGLTPTERIVEYAAFAVRGVVNVKPMLVPNVHFYGGGEVAWRWDAVERGARANQEVRFPQLRLA